MDTVVGKSMASSYRALAITKDNPEQKRKKDKLKKKLERGEVEPQAKTNRNQVLNLSKITKHKRKIWDLPTRGELLDGGQN